MAKIRLDPNRITTEVIGIVTPIIIKWLATKLAIFSFGPVSWISSFLIKRGLTALSKVLILAAKDLKISMDVNFDVKAMQDALSAGHSKKPLSEEEKAKANEDIKKALDNLISINR